MGTIAKIAEITFNVWILAEIYVSIFGFFKCVDWILICGSCFVLFLVVECNNPIENISHSMTVMISSSNKSWASRGLNWYITKSLECPKSLTNCLKIKNYTIFGKQFLSKFHICYQKIVYFYTCYRKRTLNTKIAQMFFQCLILSEI